MKKEDKRPPGGSKKKLKDIDRSPILGMVFGILAGLMNASVYLISSMPYQESETVGYSTWMADATDMLSLSSIVLIIFGMLFALTSDKESKYRKPSVIVNVISAITIFVIPLILLIAMIVLLGVAVSHL